MTNDYYQALILAAGRSSRMGTPKPQLPWLEEKPLLLWLVEKISAGGWRPVVVLGPAEFDFWRESLDGQTVLNPAPERGKTTSVAIGAARLPVSAKKILITSVDQPRPAALYRQLREIAETRPEKIVVPDWQGSRGHPVVLCGSLREQLLALGESSLGLRSLLDSHRAETYRVPGCDPSWLKWDLNTPQDYREALAFFQDLVERDLRAR